MAQLSVKGRQFFRRKSKGCSAQVFFETAALPRPWNGHNIGLFSSIQARETWAGVAFFAGDLFEKGYEACIFSLPFTGKIGP